MRPSEMTPKELLLATVRAYDLPYLEWVRESHPSMEGILLFLVLFALIRAGALKRPGLILGSFMTLYGIARIAGECFREPDPQLGFLWRGMTMGMLLSVPMIIAGIVLFVFAWRHPRVQEPGRDPDKDSSRDLNDAKA